MTHANDVIPLPDSSPALELGDAPDGSDAVDAQAFVSNAELRDLLRQASERDDVPLRRLVTGYLTLRRIGADVIAFLEARDGAATVARTPLLLRARHLMRLRR